MNQNGQPRWASTGEPVTYEQQKHQVIQDHNAHMVAIILPVALVVIGIGWWLKKRKQNDGWN